MHGDAPATRGWGKGHRSATWLRRGLARLCDDAGVPVICPPGGRGTHSTLAEGAGVAGEAVARQLGHTSHRVTEAHYLAPGTTEQVAVNKVASQIAGGNVIESSRNRFRREKEV